MQRYFETLADARGNVQAGLSVLVKIGGQNATIYSDNGTTVQANPMTSDSSGGISFYAANGTYDLSLVAASGAVTALRSQIILFDPLDCEDGTPTSSSTVLGETGGVVKRFAASRFGVIVSPLSYGAAWDGSTNDATAIQAAIDAIDTTGGKGGVVVLPDGAASIGSTSITGRTNVRVVGGGRRATIVNYSGSGSAFVFDGTTEARLEGLRIGLGSSATAVALDVKTTSADVMQNTFADLEIASSNVSGQIGIKATASGGHIVSENWFTDIFITGLDKPIVRTDVEGNIWRGLVLANFGSGAGPVAFNSSGSHADFAEMRVAGVGAGVTSPIAYQETGDQNLSIVSADIGTSPAKAINSTNANGYNTLIVKRAENATPLGTVGATDICIDGQATTIPSIGSHVSWTPEDKSGAALSFTVEGTPTYSVVGKQVTACFAILYPATADGSTAAISLPSVSKNLTTSQVSFSISYTDYGTPITGVATSGGDSVGFVTFAGVSLTNANLSGKRIRGSVTYFV